ncbi:PAS domain-containing protein [Kamptonema sp. UHCC 0994]|uniref:sensor histidine kinase n=1 Tax=Kamptonema sp. UHCC 0994 TaxID=3031329 RepID=UPI0023B90B36|nr:PAS domain-containing protein [Kamptonema sp. UHCC 0994]MDF0552532.1 PAS domain-containing protein [Kamptonema sp. UHCC 0994]
MMSLITTIVEQPFDSSYFNIKAFLNNLGKSLLSKIFLSSDGSKGECPSYQQTNLEIPPSVTELSDLKSALDQTAIWVTLDAKGLINDVNDKFCQISQYSRQELIGKDPRLLNSGNHSEAFFNSIWSTISRGKVWQGEINNRAKDRSYFWLDVRIVPFFDKQGKPFQYLAIAFDITSIKLANSSLQQNEERLRLALEAANTGIWDWNILTNQLIWYHNTEQLLGLSLGTFQGSCEAFLEYVYQEDREFARQTINLAVQEKKTCEFDFRVIWTNGSIHWMVLKTQLHSDKNGQPLRMVGTTMDITKRKAAEIALYQQTERERLVSAIAQRLHRGLERQVKERTAQLQQALDFEAMLKRITDKVRDSLDENHILQTAVQELGIGLGVRCCNASLYDLDADTSTICYEWTNSMFSDRGRVALMADYPEIYQVLFQAQYLQFCNTNPNPVRGKVAMLACPIFDDRGVIGDLWLINDRDYAFRELELRMVQQVATQCAIAIRQARLYEAAQAQVKSLEKLNWLKDDFLSTVSHELRAPVANMKMAIRMLEICMKQDQLSPQTRQKATQYLEVLQRECDREITLINDLLDLQRLEAGRQSLVLETVQIQHWLPQLVAGFKERAEARQLTIIIDIPQTQIPPLVSDISSLDRLVSELLNNACKYTPPGQQIIVSIRAQPGKVKLKITNFGTEIPTEEFSRIFDKFYRIKSADPWKQGGTGLGLALVKRLAEHLGGTIHVESANVQTSFTVELPNQGVLSKVG